MNIKLFNASTPQLNACDFRVFRVFRGSESLRSLSSLQLISVFAFFVVNFFLVTSAVAGPKIQFAAPIFDFGRVRCGEVVSHTFTFTNTGDQSLELTDVRPSCGCTTAGMYDRTIAPGKTGNIPIQFSSANSTGLIGKTVIVLCNDPLQTNIILQIKGTVWKPVEVTPAVASFRITSDSQTNETRRIQIVSNLAEPLELSQPECTNKAFQTALHVVRPGKEYELEVSFHSSPHPESINAPVSLKTTSTNLPLITIPAFALVQAAVIVAPAEVTVPAGPLTSSLQLPVNIRNYGASTLVLSDPTINVPGAELQVREIQPGRHFILSANFPTGFEIQPGQRAEIRIKTNHPQFPLLTIPVVAGHSLAASLRETEAAFSH
jgi:hypothetical protein